MPRLPSAQDYPGSAPSPTRGMTQVGAVRETADLATGRVISGIGEMMALEAEKLDETVALDALNQLQNKQLDLTYGENGFTKLQGKGVIDGKITSEYPAQLKAEAERLRTTIKSTGGQSKFDQRASAVVRSFTQGTYQHAAKETETFHVQAFKGAVSNAVKTAELGAFADGVSAVLPVVEAEIQRQQLDSASAEALRRDALGPVYSAGIKQLLAAGQSGAAKDLLADAKPWMTPQQVEHFSGMVKTQSDYDVAGQWVDEALAKNMKPAEAYDYFRKKGAGNKDAVETARGQFEHYVALKAKEDAEGAAPMMIGFHDGGASFAAKAAVVKSPAFINAKPEVQVKLLDYMDSHAKATLQFGQSQHDRAERKKMEDPEVLIAFQNLMDSPETLMAYTDGHLQGVYLPILGPQLTAKVVAVRNHMNTEAGRFKIEKAAIDEVLPDSLKKITGEAEMRQKQRFYGLVTEGLTDWKLQNPGKIPDKQQQGEIIFGATREVQQAGSWWGTNVVPAYKTKPVPPDFREQAKAAAAKSGKSISESRILELWALRKESR